ncbi:mitochondrial chaperone BCS1 [Hysterangium stoloniferum]|nr:mitochondrial chaperone BCS1 [Hysterangium stoloniferum]
MFSVLRSLAGGASGTQVLGLGFPHNAVGSAPWSWIAAFLGNSFLFPSLVSNSVIWDAVRLFVLGSLIETGRRVFGWIWSRWTFRCSVSGTFEAENPTYDWLVSYLIKEKIWNTPRDFFIERRSSEKKWKVFQDDLEHENPHIDYVPSYRVNEFFRWRGYIMEVTHKKPPRGPRSPDRYQDIDEMATYDAMPASLTITIYTRNSKVLFDFVENARLKHLEISKGEVTIHSRGRPSGRRSGWNWGTVQTKRRRPIDSVLLDGNVMQDLLDDAREFMKVEDWYVQSGIPHRRGYLLHGPPGTGKTSTVYTLAGELGLDIYALSLSSSLDDSQLAQAVSGLPHRAILLIEDIDCAFASRLDDEEETYERMMARRHPRGRRQPMERSTLPSPANKVTLSGLLNVLDGIGSEEGKLFFATTNHIERLDPALLRPGRIDRKIGYRLASTSQIRALFVRLFPERIFCDPSAPLIGGRVLVEHLTVEKISMLADEFAEKIPAFEFSVAEIQGFILGYKFSPRDAVGEVEAWVEKETRQRRETQEQKTKLREQRMKAEIEAQVGMTKAIIDGIGNAINGPRNDVDERYMIAGVEKIC